MKEKLAQTYMKSAALFAELSYCNRARVGCVIVKDNRIISIGYNGTPPGWDNNCEDENGKTKPEVSHAELNAIVKLATSHESSVDASVFITHEPCIDCAVILAKLKIKDVYYAKEFTANSSALAGISGLEHLAKCNIPTYHLPINNEQQK